jgi:diguanylate cyclase (GGDEF)-like protein
MRGLKLKPVERELKRKAYGLYDLYLLSGSVKLLRDLEELLNSFLLTILGQLGCRSSAVLLPQEEGVFQAKYAKGIQEGEELVISDKNPLVGLLLKEGRPLPLKGKGFEVLVPIGSRSKLLGILAVGQKIKGGKFTSADLEMLTILSNMISVAISNINQSEKLEEITYVDELTGLYNYRSFSLRLKEETLRAKRFGRYLSLSILDLDFFNLYNQHWGEKKADLILKQVAAIMRSSLRDVDIPFRYGGEEFAFIMPEADRKGCKELMERVRANVEEYPFSGEKLQPKKKLTASLGGVTLPYEAKTVEELIYKADLSLYKAKNLGRNLSLCWWESQK